jgi:hypothetical protein
MERQPDDAGQSQEQDPERTREDEEDPIEIHPSDVDSDR